MNNPRMVILSFPEFGREQNFRDVAIRREDLSKINDALHWHGLPCASGGEGRAHGETCAYLRVHDENKAILIARTEAALLGCPWVEIGPLRHPGTPSEGGIT